MAAYQPNAGKLIANKLRKGIGIALQWPPIAYQEDRRSSKEFYKVAYLMARIAGTEGRVLL